MQGKRITALRISHLFLRYYSASQPSSSSGLPKTPILVQHKPKSEGVAAPFVDFKRVTCIAGSGGNGLVSFLRLKNNPFAGPDGGDGGNGGHVIFVADSTFKDFARMPSHMKGNNGGHGLDRIRHGRSAGHYYVKVPLNSMVKRRDGEVVYELTKPGEVFIAARGGAGGHGNHFYLSNDVRAPQKAEKGGAGEEVEYDLELRIMAAAGFVGFPNAGKSSLLRAISRAKPKVAFYPFTTLKPHIGIVHYEDYEQIPVADIPGLVEGAHKNVGLGFEFLRHIERVHCLFYVIDYTLGDHRDQFEALQTELRLYDPKLMEKPSAVLMNKMDLCKDDSFADNLPKVFPEFPIFPISAKQRTGLIPMLVYLREEYDKNIEEQKRIKKEKEEWLENYEL